VVLHTTYVLWSTIKLWCYVSFVHFGGKWFLVFPTYGTYCTVGFTQNRETVAQVQKKTYVECTKYLRRHTPAKAFSFWREIVFGVFYIWYLLYSGLHPKQGYHSPGTKKSM
jgi:hypothetical protein